MASLFLARHVDDSNKRYVIKKIVDQYNKDASFIKLFKREAKLSLQLKHPNLVRTFQFGNNENDLFIVMEYIHGLSLTQVNSVKKLISGV